MIENTAPKYYTITNIFETDERERRIRRWGVELLIDRMAHPPFYQGAAIESWDAGTVAACESRGPTEDMPWTSPLGCPPIVSDRLRKLLEERAPGNCEFLPVRMRYKDKPLPLEPYWVLNILNVVDCIDMEKSDIKPSKYFPGTYMVGMKVVLRAEAIPESVRVLRVKHNESQMFARGDVVEAMRRAGISGFWAFDAEA